jgi:stress response protein YsnF
MIPLTKEAV